MKFYLISIAERQARYNDSIELSLQSYRDAQILHSISYQIIFLTFHMKFHLKNGHFDECERLLSELNRLCSQSIEKNHHVIEFMMIKSYYYYEKSKLQITIVEKLQLLQKCLQNLFEIKQEYERLCHGYGSFDVDTNFIYGTSPDDVTSVVRKYDFSSPLLHNFTSIESNFPSLSTYSTIDSKLINQLLLINSKGTLQDMNQLIHERKNDSFMITFSDPFYKNYLLNFNFLNENFDKTFVTFQYMNIYFYDLRTLVVLHGSICCLIDEIRESNLCHYEAIDSKSSLQLSVNDSTNDNDDEPITITMEELLQQQIVIAENGLKVFTKLLFLFISLMIIMMSYM
jgi:hypothetical protein